MSKTALRLITLIILFNFIVTDVILSGHSIRQGYAQDFNATLDSGKNLGYDSSLNYSPLFLNNTLNNKGLGSTSDITPRFNDAITQQGDYSNYYSDVGSMSSADTNTEANNFVVTTAENRDKFDLAKDTTFGNRCIERDADNTCTMWSTSSDIIGNTYSDCDAVIVPEYEPDPTFETCTAVGQVDATSCNVRTFADIQTETVYQTCDKINIEYRPGQIYAVCRDYYEIYRDQISDDRSQNDCHCGEAFAGALCGAAIPTDFTVIPPWPTEPPDLRYIGTSAQNFYDRGEIDGDVDYCSYQQFRFYSQYKRSVIERVILQYDNPCGATLSQLGQSPECVVWNFQQCDTSGVNCSVIVQDGVDTGVNPAADGRACDNFSGSIDNYQICLNYNNVNLNERTLTNVLVTVDEASSNGFGDTIYWRRMYGGADIRPLFNFWYSKVEYRCNNVSNSCQPYIDQGCTLYGQRCTDLDCNNYEYTYRCGGTGAVKNVQKAYNCLGDVKCMGSECKDASYNSNKDFAAATAAMEVLNQLRVDSTEFEIFSGEEQQCMSGPKDCCKKPDGGMSVADYVKFGKATIDAYTFLNGGSAATWANYADAFSYVSSLGNQGTLSGLVGIESLPGNSINVVLDPGLLDSGAADALSRVGYTETWSSGGNVVYSGSSQAVSSLATVATVVTIAYTVYTIGMMVYNWIYQCTEDDIIASQKDGMRICHEVGEYCDKDALGICLLKKKTFCCFNSLLARVLHEQARPLINKPWGDPEAPNCGGFSPGELASIDFGQVDLTEYMQYITYNNQIPPERLQDIMDKTMDTLNTKFNEAN